MPSLSRAAAQVDNYTANEGRPGLRLGHGGSDRAASEHGGNRPFPSRSLGRKLVCDYLVGCAAAVDLNLTEEWLPDTLIEYFHCRQWLPPRRWGFCRPTTRPCAAALAARWFTLHRSSGPCSATTSYAMRSPAFNAGVRRTNCLCLFRTPLSTQLGLSTLQV